jgi:hypothetical protein
MACVMRYLYPDNSVFSGSNQIVNYILHAVFYFCIPTLGASHSPMASQCFCSPQHISQNVWLASSPTPTITTKSILGNGEDLFLLYMPFLYYHPTPSRQPLSGCQSAVWVSTACYPAMVPCTISYLNPYTWVFFGENFKVILILPALLNFWPHF